MAIIYMLYSLAVIGHVVAFVMGLIVIGRYSCAFQQTSFLDIFKSTVERRYWIVALSTTASFLLIVALSPYIFFYVGDMPVANELVFSVFHFTEAVVIVLFHWSTLKEFEEMGIGDVGKTLKKC